MKQTNKLKKDTTDLETYKQLYLKLVGIPFIRENFHWLLKDKPSCCCGSILQTSPKTAHMSMSWRQFNIYCRTPSCPFNFTLFEHMAFQDVILFCVQVPNSPAGAAVVGCLDCYQFTINCTDTIRKLPCHLSQQQRPSHVSQKRPCCLTRILPIYLQVFSLTQSKNLYLKHVLKHLENPKILSPPAVVAFLALAYLFVLCTNKSINWSSMNSLKTQKTKKKLGRKTVHLKTLVGSDTVLTSVVHIF